MIERELLERLAPTGLPEPWLAVLETTNRGNYVVEIASSDEEIDRDAIRDRWRGWLDNGAKLVVLCDHADLRVQYQGGLYCCGYVNAKPAHLTARQNWFLRYQHILASHLRDPLPTLVQFYDYGAPDDMMCTMRSSKDGPFGFPREAAWPKCGSCGAEMAYIGTLDFRDYARVGRIAGLPVGALVLHGCDQCGIPGDSDKSSSLTWLSDEQPLAWRSRGNAPENAIEVGTAYETIEFPMPAFEPEEISNDPDFLKEWGLDMLFTCPLNKVGGHLQWIEPDEDLTPLDARGKQMNYIGQFIASRDVPMADSGTVYLFYSPETGETGTALQYC